MSNLPHPLGDTNPGDLFYPGSPDVIATDAPGAAGSRAVEFGEDGLSSAVNRAVYALAKNDEYQEERLEEEFARPDLLTFTPAGGNGDSYTFSTRVWCGDTYYTPENQDVRNALISVLDERYNDVVDPSTGFKIVVKEILDAPAGTSQVGTGFFTNPYITFRTQDPVSGSLGADYTIPDGQKVWLAFGRAATLESLTTDTNVRDSWFRGFTRSIKEIHAATFLKDGSRPATGDFYMAGQGLLEVGVIWGYPSAPLTISTSGPIGHLNLLSDAAQVRFKDNWLPSYLPLNDGDTSIVGDYTSILTSLNSKTRTALAFYGNRCLDRAGSFTVNGTTGQIDWPELNVVLGGEAKTIAAGNIIATAVSVQVLVVDFSGAIVDRDAGDVRSTDIPLFSYFWASYISTFTKALDVRWVHKDNTKAFEITCGDTIYTCDFNSGQLREAVELACLFSSSVDPGQRSHVPVIRIVGAVASDDTVGKISIWAPIKILGNGRHNSILKSSEILGDTVDFFDCQGNEVVFEDLTIMHSGDEQTVGLAAFKNPGTGSRFRNISFRADPYTYGMGFGRCFNWTMAANSVTIEEIYVEQCRGIFVMGSSTDFNTPYLTESVIRDCQLSWGGIAAYAIVANGDGNLIQHVRINSGLDEFGIVVGNDTLVDHCRIRMTGAGAIAPAGVYYHPVIGADFHTGCMIRDSFFLRIAGAGVLSSAVNNVSLILRVDVRNCAFHEVDKPIDFNSVLACQGGSSTLVDGCQIVDCNNFIASYENIPSNVFSNNTCTTIGGDGVYVRSFAGARIHNNYIEGYGSGGTQVHAIAIDIGGYACEVKDNIIGNAGAPSASIQMDIWRKCAISGNVLAGSANAAIGLQLNSYFWFVVDLPASVSNVVTGNIFDAHGTACIKVTRGTAAASYYGGQTITANNFSNVPNTGLCVWVDEVEGVTISNNEFVSCAGGGVRIRGTTYGGADCKVTGNRFKAVLAQKDYSPYERAVVAIHGSSSGCQDCQVSDNLFQQCGSTTGAASYVQSIIGLDGAGACQVHNNHIVGLSGISSSSDQGDYSYGIRLGPGSCNRASILGNYLFQDMSIAGRAADKFYGIYITGTGCFISNNYIRFSGTQSDAEKTDVLYGIIGTSGYENHSLVCNYVDVDCIVTGITIKRAIYDTNNFLLAVGNFGTGGDVDFSGYNVLLVGNYQLINGTFVYTNHALNMPDTTTTYSASARTPMADINAL